MDSDGNLKLSEKKLDKMSEAQEEAIKYTKQINNFSGKLLE